MCSYFNQGKAAAQHDSLNCIYTVCMFSADFSNSFVCSDCAPPPVHYDTFNFEPVDSRVEYYDSPQDDPLVFTAAHSGCLSFDASATNASVGFALLADAQRRSIETYEPQDSQKVTHRATEDVEYAYADEMDSLNAEAERYCQYLGVPGEDTPAQELPGWGTLSLQEIAQYVSSEMQLDLQLDYDGVPGKHGFVFPTVSFIKQHMTYAQFIAIVRTFNYFLRCLEFSEANHARRMHACS